MMNSKGMTLIELIISMAIISVLVLVMFQIFLPITQNLNIDKGDMANYKQLLFAAGYLDTIYRQDKYEECEVKEKELRCFNRTLINLSNFGTTTISIQEFPDSRHAEMIIGKWIVRFGLFPNVFLL